MGVRAVYGSIDPATAAMEVAVHKGFRVLDTMRHYLTSARIRDPDEIHVVPPEDVPNPNWLAPTPHSAGQRSFGDELLEKHLFVLIPSAVSRHSWNLFFDADRAAGHFDDVIQERFALDSRLHS